MTNVTWSKIVYVFAAFMLIALMMTAQALAAAEPNDGERDRPVVADVILDDHHQPRSAIDRAYLSTVITLFENLSQGDDLRLWIPGQAGDAACHRLNKRDGDDAAILRLLWEDRVLPALGKQNTDLLGLLKRITSTTKSTGDQHLVVALVSRRLSKATSRELRDIALDARELRGLIVIVGADEDADELGLLLQAAGAGVLRFDPLSRAEPARWIEKLRPAPQDTPAASSTDKDRNTEAIEQILQELNIQSQTIADEQKKREESQYQQRVLEQELDRVRASDNTSSGEVQRLNRELQQARDATAHAQGQSDAARHALESLQQRVSELGLTAPARPDSAPTLIGIGPVLVNVGAEPASVQPAQPLPITDPAHSDYGNPAIDELHLTPDLDDIEAQVAGGDDSVMAPAGEATAAVKNAGGSHAERTGLPIFGGVVVILAAAAVAAMYLNRKPAARTFTLLDESSKASHRIQMTSNERVDLNGAQPVKKARAGNGRVPFLTIDRKGRLALHPAHGFFTKLNDRLISAAETAMVKPGSVLEITANGQISRLVVGPVSVVNQNLKPPLNLQTPSMHPA